MTKLRLAANLLLVSVISVVTWCACATISPFDQFAYAQVTAAKVEVINLVEKSSEPYAAHAKEVEAMNSTLFKIVEYEKHRPKNRITIQMWNRMFMVDSAGNINETSIIPSYWAKWKRDGQERKVFIGEAKGQIAEGFDLIAELEASKIKSTDSRIAAFLKK